MSETENPAPPAVERWVVRFGIAIAILGVVAGAAATLTGDAWWPVLAFLGVVALMVGVFVLFEAHELHISPAAAWRRQRHRVKANTHLPRWARRR